MPIASLTGRDTLRPMNTEPHTIARIIESLGGATKAAKTLHLASPSVILNWRARGSIPAQYVLSVANATGIEPHILRPDVFRSPEKTA